MSTRVGMVSLGCPKNQVDAEHMLYDLKQQGFELVADAALSDVVIVNTCGQDKGCYRNGLSFGKIP